MSLSQKLLSKNRVFDDQNNPLKNGQIITRKYIQVAVFEGITRGLKPIFEVDDFALFDKPSGVMVHPTRKDTPYCLLDEVRYHFGDEANLAHRIDAQTSGLVLVSKNKQADGMLKTMFEHRKYKKEYLALVKGKITSNIAIEKSIAKANGNIGIKMTCETKIGKKSLTYIYPLKFNKKDDTTLVKVVPITGRQHQIRVHLDSIGHSIVGDPIYGVDDIIAHNYLSKTLSEKEIFNATGGARLMLHANKLSFTYKNTQYNIQSKKPLTDFLK